jgi:hypothetical protein
VAWEALGRGSGDLADVECFALAIQPFLQGDDLLGLQFAWHFNVEPIRAEAHHGPG